MKRGKREKISNLDPALIFSLQCIECERQMMSAVQVGLIATNDSIVLEGCIYRILQRHFRTSPAYGQLLELFHEVSIDWADVEHLPQNQTGHLTLASFHYKR